MTIKSDTLRPGLLVSLKSSTHGNVSYVKRVVEPAKLVDGVMQKAKWETERTITDYAEHEAGQKARAKARSLVTAVCATSAFGLLCPESDSAELEAAIAEARKVCEEFNATAKLSRVTCYVITGRIAADDVEAVKAINSEIRELMETMESGLGNLDVKAVRDAATRAKEIGAMLPPETEARVRIAVEAAREAAKKIVKAGEQAAQEIDRSAMRKIAEARTAFLDLDGATDVARPAAASRAIDLTPELLPSGAEAPQARPRLDLE